MTCEQGIVNKSSGNHRAFDDLRDKCSQDDHRDTGQVLYRKLGPFIIKIFLPQKTSIDFW